MKSTPGYCSIDERYEDKLTMTSSSISYEYKPYPMAQSTNVYRKWSYKTNSPIYKFIFDEIVERTPQYLKKDDLMFCCDAGSIEITAVFEDKHKETADYFCSGDFFGEYFTLIKKLLPECEYVPVVILTSEDYDTEESKSE